MCNVVENASLISTTPNYTRIQHPHTACKEFVEKAKVQEIKVRGPVRMPVKTLRITTRKTPNGEGTKTWDRYEMRIYKRILDFQSQFESLKSITDIMYVRLGCGWGVVGCGCVVIVSVVWAGSPEYAVR